MKITSVTEVADTVVEQPDAEANMASPVLDQTKPSDHLRGKILSHRAVILIIILAAVAAIIALASTRILSKASTAEPPPAEPATMREPNSVTISPSQIQSIKLEPASSQAFRAEKIATGKIAFNEDVMTPVFSPYGGRVIRLLAKPGDVIKQGSLLVEIDTPDLVQNETDLITAGIPLAKSNATLELARRTEDR